MVLIVVRSVVLRRAKILEIKHWGHGLLCWRLLKQGRDIKLRGGKMLLIVIHLLLCCLQVRMSLLSLLGEIDLAVGVDRRYILVLGCSICDQGAIRVLVLEERTITC